MHLTHRTPRTVCIALLGACGLLPLASQAKTLSADPYSVSWSHQVDEYRCTIEQEIPRFGKMVFSQSPDTEIAFEIRALTPLYRGSETKLKARPPSWRTDLNGFLIARNSKTANDKSVATFNTENSKLAFKSLRDGFRLQLSLVHGTPPEKLDISIEGLGFNTLVDEFERCKIDSRKRQMEEQLRLANEKKAAEELAQTMAKLESATPKKAALTEAAEEPKKEDSLQVELENLADFYRVPFDSHNTELSQSSAGGLDQLLRRWQLGGMPEQVTLHGHADDEDSTNNSINSDLRAQAVARYLLSKMPDLNLRIEAHGDTQLIEKVSGQRVDVMPSDLPNWE